MYIRNASLQMKASLTLVLAAALQGALAQTAFNVVREHPSTLSYNGALSVSELTDGYLMFSYGWSLDSTVGAVQIAKFDLEGNFLWEKEHRRERNAQPGIIDPIRKDVWSAQFACLLASVWWNWTSLVWQMACTPASCCKVNTNSA